MDCREQHDHTGHDHDHDHDHEPEDASGDSLFPYIDTVKMRCLNAMDPSAVSHPIKPHEQRQDREKYLDSNEDDPEFILFIPFTETVTIKSICIGGGEDGMHPKVVKLYDASEEL